jgi:hypothetical protein
MASTTWVQFIKGDLVMLYLGVNAMTHGVTNLTNNNMSAPLLAKAFVLGIFTIISMPISFITLAVVSLFIKKDNIEISR